MRKAKHTAGDLRAEYKLSDFKTRGVRGKHLKRYRAGKRPASRSTANGRKR